MRVLKPALPLLQEIKESLCVTYYEECLDKWVGLDAASPTPTAINNWNIFYLLHPIKVDIIKRTTWNGTYLAHLQMDIDIVWIHF